MTLTIIKYVLWKTVYIERVQKTWWYNQNTGCFKNLYLRKIYMTKCYSFSLFRENIFLNTILFHKFSVSQQLELITVMARSVIIWESVYSLTEFSLLTKDIQSRVPILWRKNKLNLIHWHFLFSVNFPLSD